MQARVCISAVCLLLCMPVFTHASVVISEVAWMGSLDDANAEWIELYNTGEAVDVTGWTLTAIDGQPSITLEGTLAGNSYALLERTDDDTVPGVPMFMIYTGALGNAGEKLELRDGNGTLVDSVNGLDGWSIGGDNTTKDTLQRSGEPAVGGWITAPPSPMRGYTGSGTAVSTGGGTQTSRSTKVNILTGISDTKEKEDRPRLEPALILDLGEERTVIVGVPTEFLARAYKERGEEIVVHDVEWNFGDGVTKKGREVSHTYQYEGSYVVSATGYRSGFLRDITDTAHTVVHVVASPVEIAHVDATYIELKNTSDGMVDISSYVLLSGASHFTIPKNTLLLPNTLVRFSHKATKITGEQVRLYRPDGSPVSVYGGVDKPTQVTRTALLPAQASQKVTPAVKRDATVSVPEESEYVATAIEFTEAETIYMEDVETDKDDSSNIWWWIVGLIVSIATAGVSVMLLRHEQREEIEGFLIESEK